ncbi:MAG: septum formation initiator family protein [Lachnospiraceae bacterium]|nr:septum formation initiator family protein [Lachnospiraceae bacterium]
MARTALSKKKKRSSAVGYVLMTLVVLAITGIVLIQRADVARRLSSYEAQAAELQEQIDSENDRAAELDEFEKYVQTKAYAEEQAHEKLGLVNEGEIVFRLDGH